ncbi:hypothetical protein [Deinococcus aerolatus]|uniref:hypothetical protein n=1 Tax=Deinococcus aerolatus TaxID=522487 RepID=UPI001666A882|nr:hypothetical protein [Deinococcus aerolatus]
MRQQLEQEWHGHTSPVHCQHQRVDIGLPQFPVRAVKGEVPPFPIGEQRQNQTGNIQRTQRMLVKESLNLANDRSRLSVARATLGQ